jgi:triosephosphate isomerase
MRKNIVAGNWKMNNDFNESNQLAKKIHKSIKHQDFSNLRIIVSPTFVNLKGVVKRLKKSSIEVAAQNMHQNDSGAFTGEISAQMLQSIGVNMVILGHSERREYFCETDKALASKVDQAIKYNLDIIFCFGEKLADRKSENHFKIVEKQLRNALFHLDQQDWNNIILAYEPVWAIGTGETASPDQAQEMHAFIRNLLVEKYGDSVAQSISILYGGSVKPDNASTIFSKKDVDGGLIGGAALKADDFVQIIKAI